MDQHQPNDQPSSARRKLIRGTFAVPAVLTLHSGASVAAASVNSCLKRQNSGASTQPVAAQDDAWFRYQLWGYVNSANGEISLPHGFWIKGSDLAVYDMRGNSVWLKGAAYQRFDVASNSLLSQIEYGQPKGPDNCSWKRVNHWVSLRVDRHGNLTGAGRSGFGSAVADSCWNSFAIGTRT